MKSIFKEYQHLWPPTNSAAMQELLNKIVVGHFPRDKVSIKNADKNSLVVVLKKSPLKHIITLLEQGVEHCVQEEREDFAEELFASTLMALRPDIFMSNPIPFFFNGFKAFNAPVPKEQNIVLPFSSNAGKATVLDRLTGFLDYSLEMASLKSLCLQVADEMYTNAVFNAPVRASGVRPFAHLPRSSSVQLPRARSCKLFACFSSHRVIIGCEDNYGSLMRGPLLLHLHNTFKDSSVSVRSGKAGAGLGFKHMIENSANFYVLCERGKRTLVACGFRLRGLKANITTSKHVHFSFR